MKTIGLIGTNKWDTTADYCHYINELSYRVSSRCAKFILQSVSSYTPNEYIQAAQQLEAYGADYVVVCSDDAHAFADDIQRTVSIPLVHSADAAAIYIRSQGIERIYLAGLADHRFYQERLQQNGLYVTAETPSIHLSNIVHDAVRTGAEAVLFSGSSVHLLKETFPIPVFHTALLHAEKAVSAAISSSLAHT